MSSHGSNPIGFSYLLLTCAAAALFLFAARISPYVSPATLQKIDRAVFIVCAAVISFALLQHIRIASARGDISFHRFAQFFMAGGICAFLTHAACTPIDVVKTRIQTTHGKYNGLLDGSRKIIAEEGPAALLKGLNATAGGYFLHGAFKYSLYEVFKVIFSPNAAAALKPPLSIAAVSGVCAECLACLLLCPMEAVRIRSVSDHLFPSGAIDGLNLLVKVEGLHGLYKGLPAMLLKQVPYTVGQFVAFEYFVVVVRAAVFAALGLTAGTASSSVVAFIAALAGLLAGVMAAIVSHPGDTILSRINQEESEGSSFAQIERVVRTAGFSGLFSGLSVRIIQVSCMVGGQFVIYDVIKLMCGIMPASAVGTAASLKHAAVEPKAIHGRQSMAAVNNDLRPHERIPRGAPAQPRRFRRCR